MRNYFTLDGVDSRTMGVYISGQGTFSSPARAVDFIPVPGRNGDLIGLETRLENGVLTYKDSFIFANFDVNFSAFKALLLSGTGYRRLVDSYHPDEYRMVAYADRLEPAVTRRNNAAQFDIVFNAMPQRWLLSGETAQTFTAAGTITNPTDFPARPLLTVYGAGACMIGATQITIESSDPYTVIDCQAGYCYYGATPKNRVVTLSANDFPILPPGDTGIALGEGITQIDVIPRWWRV